MSPSSVLHHWFIGRRSSEQQDDSHSFEFNRTLHLFPRGSSLPMVSETSNLLETKIIGMRSPNSLSTVRRFAPCSTYSWTLRVKENGIWIAHINYYLSHMYHGLEGGNPTLKSAWPHWHFIWASNRSLYYAIKMAALGNLVHGKIGGCHSLEPMAASLSLRLNSCLEIIIVCGMACWCWRRDCEQGNKCI